MTESVRPDRLWRSAGHLPSARLARIAAQGRSSRRTVPAEVLSAFQVANLNAWAPQGGCGDGARLFFEYGASTREVLALVEPADPPTGIGDQKTVIGFLCWPCWRTQNHDKQ